MQAHVKRNVYEVFAQIEPGGPISHIGNLNAPGIELAKVYARRIYDEERWSEMWVVAREQIVVAHPDDSSPFESTSEPGRHGATFEPPDAAPTRTPPLRPSRPPDEPVPRSQPHD